MRVLVVNVFAGPKSRQAIWSSLAAATGWDIHLLVGETWTDDYGNTVTADVDAFSNLQVHAGPVGLSGNIPLYFWKLNLRKLVAEISPDLVYMYSEPYALSTIQIVASLPRKMIVGVHSAQNLIKRYPLPFRWSQRYVLKRADFATVVSEEVCGVMRHRNYRGPISLHTFGLSSNWFTDLPSSPVAGLGRVAYVGRLTQEKGVDVLLDALIDVADVIGEVRVVGDGLSRDRYEDRVRSDASLRKIVKYEGFKSPDQMTEVYDWADIIVVPSLTTKTWKEQFGRVVIEAGARGCMPLTSSSGELPLLIQRLGFGEVTPEADSKALARAMRKVASDLSGIRGQRREMSKRVEDLYSELAVAGELATAFRATRKSQNRRTSRAPGRSHD